LWWIYAFKNDTNIDILLILSYYEFRRWVWLNFVTRCKKWQPNDKVINEFWIPKRLIKIFKSNYLPFRLKNETKHHFSTRNQFSSIYAKNFETIFHISINYRYFQILNTIFGNNFIWYKTVENSVKEFYNIWSSSRRYSILYRNS